MKKIARLLLSAFVCMTLVGTDALAAERDRKEYKHGNSRPAQSSRPSGRPGNNGHGPHRGGNHQRPGNKPSHPGAVTPPSDHNRPSRPSAGPGRPGHSGGNNHGYRPGHGPSMPAGRPQAPRPPHGGGHGYGHPAPPPRPPHRPYMPGSWSHWRPVPPPPAYRPYASWPVFSTVLGVRFGTSIAMSLSSLATSGYNVVSNYDNTVYLQNVPMLGVYWPTATLSYTPGGQLAGSEFVSYSSWADTALYSSLYSRLCSTYGAPYSNSGFSASWWGPDGQYIRLNFANGVGADGLNRYYTTLNFGIY